RAPAPRLERLDPRTGRDSPKLADRHDCRNGADGKDRLPWYRRPPGLGHLLELPSSTELRSSPIELSEHDYAACHHFGSRPQRFGGEHPARASGSDRHRRRRALASGRRLQDGVSVRLFAEAGLLNRRLFAGADAARADVAARPRASAAATRPALFPAHHREEIPPGWLRRRRAAAPIRGVLLG